VNGVVTNTVAVGSNPISAGDATGMQAAMLFGWLAPAIYSANSTADTSRIVSNQAHGKSDISRTITAQAHSEADVLRKFAVNVQAYGQTDLRRIVSAQSHSQIDVLRDIFKQSHGKTDISRIITAQSHGKSDVSRIIAGNIAVHGKADILRSVTEQCHGKTDACRILALQSHGQLDLARIITIGCHNISDTCRKIYAQLDFADTPRIDFTLSTKDITPRYNIDSFTDYPLNSNYSQTLYNQAILLTIIKHNFKPMEGLYSLVGVDGKETLLNDTATITAPLNGNTAQTIAQALASALGKNLVWLCDDFFPASITGDAYSLTFKEIVSKIFDWSMSIVSMTITPTIRGNNFYVVQRGKEPHQYTPTNYVVRSQSTEHIYTLKTKKDIWSNATWNIAATKIYGQVNPYSIKVLFTGTIVSSTGSADIYEAGYMVEQTEMSTTTVYAYKYTSAWSYNVIAGKTSTSSNGQMVTNYIYDGNDNLIEMTELTYDSSNNLTNTSVTTYAPINYDAMGHWESKNYQNGVLTASSIQKGPSSSRVSPYLAYDSQLQKPSANVDGVPFGNSTYPISDSDTINKIATNLNYLNGKTEQKLTVEVYDQFIIDLVDYTVIIDGNEYFIDDNHVERQAEKWIQTLDLVRWY
jgi:hypothetical protein